MLIYDYLENRLVCVQQCDGAGESNFVANEQYGEMAPQLQQCCEGECAYIADPNTGLLFPVICND